MRKLLFTLLVVMLFCVCSFAQSGVIEPELQAAIEQKGDEMISVNIIFKSQMDPNQLRSKVSKVSDKKIRRDIVVNELKSFSEREQKDVMAILDAEERSGKVTKITNHWLSNVITCTTTADVIYYLSEHSSISMIGYNEEKYMLWDEKSEKVEATRGLTDNITMVNADDVWELGFTGEGVLVAVVDTGVNYNHVDLADHLWDGGPEFPNHGYNTYSNNNDPMDGNSHGTHCAGTVCGDGTSGLNTGMAPDATLMCVKCLSDGGSGDVNTISSGMEFAVEHYADVMSLSLGIASSSVSERTILRHTCVNALEAGVVAAIAAGNEGDQQWMYPIPNNVRVPGSCPPPWLHPDQESVNPGELSCVVAIGAVDYNDNPANFTSHGPVTWTNTEFADYPYQPAIGLIRPDVCAPGVDVVSCDYSNINGHISMSGTSMATPCAAGVMCLLLSKNQDLTPADISMIFETTAVKFSENKNNITGSGRIDALEAVENVTTGFIALDNYNFVEIEGNFNGNINAGENISVDMELTNTSEESVNDITFVLTTNNDKVTMTDTIANVNSIPALGTISIIDEFSFVVDETAAVDARLNFDLKVLDSNNEKIATLRLKAVVCGNEIQFSTVMVRNDDNDNGILERGETADICVVLENSGNEIAVSVSGILSTDSEYITINQSESYFSSIGNSSSSMAYFNVTASNSLPEVYNIPFTLVSTDAYNNSENYDFGLANRCNIVFELEDSFGDGWNGAMLNVSYSDGTPSDSFTIDYGSSETYTREISAGVEISLSWESGQYDLECSFVISYEGGDVIYNGSGEQDSGIFFSWINSCACGSIATQMGDPIENLVINQNMLSVELSWDAPMAGNAIAYEVYRDTKMLASIEELSYTDVVESDGEYYYSVRPIYEEYNGLFVCSMVEVTSCPTIEEINVAIDEFDMTLTWTEPLDMTDFIEYRVYINDELVGNTTETHYEKELSIGDYQVVVEAVYANCQSDITTSFSICDLLDNVEYVIDNKILSLNWTVDSNVNIEKYEIYINNVYTTESVTNEWSSEMESGYYDVRVKAISEECFSLSKVIEDIMICDIDETIFVEVSTTGNELVAELTWNAIEPISGYEVYRDGEKIAEVMENNFTDNTIPENGTYCYTVAAKCYDNIGAASEEACAIFNVDVTEIHEANVSIYPNPTKDNFFIVCDNMTNVRIYNILGEMISEESVNDDIYEVGGLNAGTYFVQIETGEGVIVRRVVKL